MAEGELVEGRVEADGVGFAYLAAGEAGAPLALCLHGFPDTAHGWRHLLPALADAGYHAVAPFMRGYAPTDVPADARYQTGALAHDAVALHRALGGDGDAVLVGHDWGALAAYGAASVAPDRWRRVVTAAVPPMGATGQGFFSYRQLKLSWYMFFFQLPLADMAVAMDDMAFLDGLWADWSPGHDAAEDLAHVKAALGTPENLAAALGYYRAQWGAAPPDPALQAEQDAVMAPPPQPTLYLHGAQDGCISVEWVDGVAPLLAPGSRVEVVDGAGHFLQLERPDVVAELVVDFLGPAR